MGSIPIAGSFSARSIGTYRCRGVCHLPGRRPVILVATGSSRSHSAIAEVCWRAGSLATLASRLAHSAADSPCRDCNPPSSGGGAMLCELCAPIETGPAGQAREIWNVCVHRGLVLATEELLQGRKVPPSTLTFKFRGER